jgi:hypothetical protein
VSCVRVDDTKVIDVWNFDNPVDSWVLERQYNLAGAPNSAIADIQKIKTVFTQLLVAYSPVGQMLYVFETADLVNNTPMWSFSAGEDIFKMTSVRSSFYLIALTPDKRTIVYDLINGEKADISTTPNVGVDVAT